MVDPTLSAGPPPDAGNRAFGLEFRATSLEKLLVEVAVGLSTEACGDVGIVARESRTVHLQASCAEELVRGWVGQLRLMIRDEDLLVARAEVQLENALDSCIGLRARLWGESFDAQWHAPPRLGGGSPPQVSLVVRSDPESGEEWCAALVWSGNEPS